MSKVPGEKPRSEWDQSWFDDEAAEKARLAGRRQSRGQFSAAFSQIDGAIDVSGDDNLDKLADKLRAFAGTSDRSPWGVDTKSAAKKLKVSQRTIQRWLKGENTPKAKHWKEIRDRSRQVATTKRGRAAAVQGARAHMSRGGFLAIRADSGPLRMADGGPTDDYKRVRNLEQGVTAEEANMMLDAYIEHGESGAVDALYEIFTNEDENKGYMETWGFDSLDSIELRSMAQGRLHTANQNLRSGKSKR